MTTATELRERIAAAEARRDAAAGSDRDPAMARVSGPLLTQLGRDTDRRLAAYTAADREVRALTSQLHLAEAREAEAARVRLTRDQVDGARFVRDRYGWHRVIRINATTVTVASDWGQTARIAITQLHEART